MMPMMQQVSRSYVRVHRIKTIEWTNFRSVTILSGMQRTEAKF
jgi:hypothetical protein